MLTGGVIIIKIQGVVGGCVGIGCACQKCLAVWDFTRSMTLILLYWVKMVGANSQILILLLVESIKLDITLILIF